MILSVSLMFAFAALFLMLQKTAFISPQQDKLVASGGIDENLAKTSVYNENKKTDLQPPPAAAPVAANNSDSEIQKTAVVTEKEQLPFAELIIFTIAVFASGYCIGNLLKK